MNDVVVRLPPLDELARRWREIEPFLKRATDRTGCYEPIDLLYLTMQGQAAIWIVEIGGSVTASVAVEAKQYPRKRILEVMFGGGDGMPIWIKQLGAAIDEHARATGCTHVATTGRPGWARAWGAQKTGDVVLVRRVWDA